MRPNPRARRGFTLLELALAGALITVVGYQATLALRLSFNFSAKETATTAMEAEAQMALDRLAYSIMSAHRDTLRPTDGAPLYSTALAYQEIMGMEDDEIVWGFEEQVGLDPEKRQVYFDTQRENGQRSHSVWCKWVSSLFKGEHANGLDDNANGLVDEDGLSFSIDGSLVTIRLSVSQSVDGESLVTGVETTVTCRNMVQAYGH